MFKIIKYITYFLSFKKVYEQPDEVVKEFSIAYVQAFFISGIVLFSILTILSFFLGFSLDFLLFKILGFIFLTILIIDIALFVFIIRTLKRMIQKIHTKARTQLHSLTRKQN